MFAPGSFGSLHFFVNRRLEAIRMNARIFVDYWNFQLAWNERAGAARCDWTSLPRELVRHATRLLDGAGLGTPVLQETRIYAGYEAGREAGLKNWLHNFLDRQPGFRVFTSERHWRARPIFCRECRTETAECPNCRKPFGRAAEKTIDALIVTDLIGLAWERAFDVAILLTADKDFIPAVEHLQKKNIHVVNGAWRGNGHELAKTCWASVELDAMIPKLSRS